MAEKEDDQQWLDALAGRSQHGTVDSATLAEAQLIRKAVLRPGHAQERAFETTEAGFQKLVDTANKRGLLRAEPRIWRLMLALQRLYEALAHPAGVMATIAIVLGLGIIVHLQTVELSNRSEHDILRGGTSAERVVLRVNEPKVIAQEWQSALLQAGVEHAVSFENPQRILIRLRLTPEALELLQTRRIQPPAGVWCTLVIESVAVRQQ